MIGPCAKAAVAVGADGLIIEAHPEPDASVSDAAQALSLPTLTQLVQELHPVAEAVGRTIASHPPTKVSTLNDTNAVRAIHELTQAGHQDTPHKKEACA